MLPEAVTIENKFLALSVSFEGKKNCVNCNISEIYVIL
jgi:hypothetical protein